ncbi:galactosyltransferase-related protein [Psychrobacter sp. WY6]|uniref:galactosyltransferase-related protein n=1 Tax=Psychrobacter sp. WY6 TaxID=2708350 RepID=UPI002022D222|nr:galactosyltransferase-related protein [Psychrobacter sp. WY6]
MKNVQSMREGFDISSFTTDNIQTYAASSSTVALRKSFYLELGGQDERFKGWGYEDWEFANRLITNYDFLPPSKICPTLI